MILCIRSDSEKVYIGLYEGDREKAGNSWVAGRELSVQILSFIENCCEKASIQMNDIKGLVIYQGPGSYTGLRIACSVANSIGYSYDIPVIGSTGDRWIKNGTYQLLKSSRFTPISPIYGGEVYTTTPRK